MRRIVLASVGWLWLVGSGCAPKSPERAVQDALASQPVGRAELPGVIVTIAVDGGVVYQAAQGVAVFGNAAPPEPTASTRIGSVTKLFTATVVLQLVAEGAVSLETPVSTLGLDLPGLEGVTVKHLLAMQSGVAELVDEAFVKEVADGDPARVWTDRELALRGTARPRVGAAGGAFSYSNTNYSVLALVIEKLTGQPFAVAVRRRIIEPLALQGTSVPGPTERALPAPAMSGASQGRDVSTLHPSYAGAAGLMTSTSSDLVTLAPLFATGALVPEASLRPAAQPTLDASSLGLPLRYSYGLMHLGEWTGHAGDVLGYSSAVFHHVKSGRTVVVLTNGTFGMGVGLARDIAAGLAPGSL